MSSDPESIQNQDPKLRVEARRGPIVAMTVPCLDSSWMRTEGEVLALQINGAGAYFVVLALVLTLIFTLAQRAF